MPIQKLYVKNLLTSEGWKTDQCITIADGKISNIEASDNMTNQNPIEFMVPGIPNVHSHGFQYAMRGLAENFSSRDDSFWSWRKLMYQFVENITPEDLRVIATTVYIDMLKAGYTAVGEFHYLHRDNQGSAYQQLSVMSEIMIETAINSGISMCHLPVLYQYGGFEKENLQLTQKRFQLSDDEFLDLHLNLQQKYAANSDINIGMAPHSLRAIDIHRFTDLLDQTENNFPIHIHISEQMAEVKACERVNHCHPIEWLANNAHLNEQWNLIHATHANENEIKQITTSGARVGLCLTTEANLGDGIFDLQTFMKNKGKFCIGSDSHISVNPVEELRWLEYGQRLKHQKRAFYATEMHKKTAENLLLDAVKNGNDALGFKTVEGNLGSKADFISLKIPLELKHLNNEQILNQWIFSSRNSWVDKVMVSGRWVISDGQHPLDDFVSKNYPKVVKKLLN